MAEGPREYWPWQPQRIEEISSDVAGYFEAYYSELRSLIAQRDPDSRSLPFWLKGSRIVDISFCADGVMVVHHPYDEEEGTFPDEREDSYEYGLLRGMLVKDAVDAVSPPRPGAERVDLPKLLGLDYPDGGRFGNVSLKGPVQLVFDLDEEHDYVEATSWTRLDVADLKNTGVWRDEEHAREEARQIIRHYE